MHRLCLFAILLFVTAASSGCCINRFGCGCDPLRIDCGECCGDDDCYNTTGGFGCGCDSYPSCGCDRRGRRGCITPHQYGCGCLGDCSLIPYLLSPFACMSRCILCPGGCGEVYMDEWLSDPPDCCDPCDPCGCWTPKGCCLPRECHMYDPNGFGYRPGGPLGWGRDRGCGGGCGCDVGCGCDSGHGPVGSSYGGRRLADGSSHYSRGSGYGRVAHGFDLQPGESIVYEATPYDQPRQARSERTSRSALQPTPAVAPQSYKTTSRVIWPDETPVSKSRVNRRRSASVR